MNITFQSDSKLLTRKASNILTRAQGTAAQIMQKAETQKLVDDGMCFEVVYLELPGGLLVVTIILHKGDGKLCKTQDFLVYEGGLSLGQNMYEIAQEDGFVESFHKKMEILPWEPTQQ